jgi:predicted nucleic acid-binding protein
LILLDTSVLVESLAGDRVLLPRLRRVLDTGEQILLPALVLYEWWRGSRTAEEVIDQEKLFPSAAAIQFGHNEAALAAKLYGQAPWARSREIDIAIAACAIVHEAALWTLNRDDFTDIPGLALANPV